VGLATAYYTKGDLATGAEVGEEALAAAERTGDPLDLLLAHVVVGFPFFDRGNFSQALNEYEQAIGLYDPSQHASFAPTLGWDRGVHAHAYAAWCHLCLGHHNRALALSEEAVALARRASPAISPVGLVAAVLLLVALAFYRMRRWREERD
jgi:tetratricopeptide (TPR) repeat protein